MKKPSFRSLVLRVLRRLLHDSMGVRKPSFGDDLELSRQLDEAIEEEENG